jgi:Protein of unknown function (DUF3309)
MVVRRSTLDHRDLVRAWPFAVAIESSTPAPVSRRAPAEIFCGKSDSGQVFMNLIVVILLVVLLLGALPTWPYSANWGYYPSGALSMVLVIVLILALLGRV